MRSQSILTLPCSMLKRGTSGDTTSNSARFKKLFLHVLGCGDHGCKQAGCLAARDVLSQAVHCNDCNRVSA
jgi:hypothetical protein